MFTFLLIITVVAIVAIIGLLSYMVVDGNKRDKRVHKNYYKNR